VAENHENTIESRIAEASAGNSRLLDAIDEIDFSTRKAITNAIFRRMVAFKVAFGWADLKICYECGVVHVTLKTFLGEEESAREIWDAAKIAYTTRLTDLAEKTLEAVMNQTDDANARVKAAMFVAERRNPDYAKRDADADAPAGGRVLLAQQIVIRITDKAGAKKRAAIEGASVDQAEIGFEPSGANENVVEALVEGISEGMLDAGIVPVLDGAA
jgi:hypothetical protein